MPSTILSQFREASRQFAARGRMLLLDGNRRDLDYFRSVLEGQGFDVCASLCCAEGLARLEEESFDFVLIDQGGPSFEGRVVLERVMEIDRHIPVVVLTGCFDKGCYLEAVQLGAVDYVEKPVSPADTLRMARKYLRPRKLAT